MSAAQFRDSTRIDGFARLSLYTDVGDSKVYAKRNGVGAVLSGPRQAQFFTSDAGTVVLEAFVGVKLPN